MSMGKGWVKPVAFAKELNIKPQQIYNWIKAKKLSTYSDGTFHSYVVDSEVRKLVNVAARKPARAPIVKGGAKTLNKTGDSPRMPPLQTGTVVSYGYNREKKVKNVAQVVEDGEMLTRLKDLDENEAIFMNSSLRSLVAEKKMRIESPGKLLSLIVTQWRLEGQFDLADSLEEWITEHELVFTGLPAEPTSHMDN